MSYYGKNKNSNQKNSEVNDNLLVLNIMQKNMDLVTEKLTLIPLTMSIMNQNIKTFHHEDQNIQVLTDPNIMEIKNIQTLLDLNILEDTSTQTVLVLNTLQDKNTQIILIHSIRINIMKNQMEKQLPSYPNPKMYAIIVKDPTTKDTALSRSDQIDVNYVVIEDT